ncbi:hypothetical protein [Myroides sp. LoEW2-1]|uniref:hypothetical protein n=1 Tax=Myroides sp. LoEW2-1 TaxID=2683192 RepID=UPI00132AAD9F|nr:hypothetical protein [Myroides sp. LoEW2-1]MVX36802.1 hypothetical protein [Myroides sp. LoEW2-1]
MKKYIIACTALLGMSFLGHAQVGIGTKNPSPSSLLEITSKDGNQGVILPQVALTSLTSFSPLLERDKDGRDLKTDPRNIGLIIYNTKVDVASSLSAGFYYWTGLEWTKVTDTKTLHSTIKEEITKAIPTLPEVKPGDKGKDLFVTFNGDTKQFSVVENDIDGKPTIKPIDFEELVKRDETKTKFYRRSDAANGTKGAYTEVGVEPGATKNAIIYKYESEKGDFFIDMTHDLYQTIENNETIQHIINETVNEHLSQGGNVYFGDHDADAKTAEILYIINDKDEKQPIDISSSILKIFTDSKEEIIKEIRASIGYDITAKAVFTGNKYQGKDIYKFAGTVGVKAGDAETEGIRMPKDVAVMIGNVLSIKLLDANGNDLGIGVCDIEVAGAKLEFSLGNGMMYRTFPTNQTFDVIVEFVEN